MLGSVADLVLVCRGVLREHRTRGESAVPTVEDEPLLKQIARRDSAPTAH